MRVALVRGPHLSAWDLRNFELPIDLTAFTSLRPPLAMHGLPMDVKRLPSPYDVVSALPQHLEWLLLRPTGSLDHLIGLQRALKGFDIAHTIELHYPFSLQAIEARDKGRCRRVIVTVWENIPARPVENRLVQRRVERVAAGADHFIAITEDARTHLRLAGVDDERITVQPMGIDVDRFTPRARNDGKGPLRVLSVARLTWEKGVEDLVIAMRLLVGAGVDAELTLVGRGRLERRLERLAGQLGIGDRVRLLGGVPYEQMPELYRESDVFVLASTPLPTWREQFGFAVVEGMASGLPVLAGDSGSLPEVVGEPDSLVRPHDPKSLARRLRELAEDPDRRRDLGARNRARAEERFDRRAIGPRILEIYERVAAAG